MRKAKAGFTLIEALAVLAITGLVVSLIYTIGVRGSFNGFRLGNRALGLTDAQIDKAAYESLLADIVVPPVAVSSEAAERELADQADDSFVGAPTQMDAYLIATRETTCARLGAVGRLTLTLEAKGPDTIVRCRLADDDPVDLMEVKGQGAAFSYSEDGQAWTSDWTVLRGQPVELAALPNGEDRHVMVRLSTEDGRSDLIGLASSGRPIAQTPPGAVGAAAGGRGAGRGGDSAGPGGRGDDGVGPGGRGGNPFAPGGGRGSPSAPGGGGRGGRG